MQEENALIEKGLSVCPIFEKLSTAERRQLAQHATIRRFDENDIIFTVENRGDAFYLVLSGEVRIRLRNHRTRDCAVGDVFGEVAIFDSARRSGATRVTEPAELAHFDKKLLFEDGFLSPGLRAKIFAALARQIISYLETNQIASVREMAEHGEDEHIEFKESASDAQLPAIAQAAAAMMNTQGGTILLGVTDTGGLQGLKFYGKERDNCVRKINMRLRNCLGELSSSLAHVSSEVEEGKEYIRIECDPAPAPVFFTEKDGSKEVLYFRASGENITIKSVRDCAAYFMKRFPKALS